MNLEENSNFRKRNASEMSHVVTACPGRQFTNIIAGQQSAEYMPLQVIRSGSMNRKQRAGVLSGSLLMLVLVAYAQTTIATGSIQGTVIDPSNKLVAAAKVIIIGKATGQVIQTTSGLSGLYDSGPLFPGEYKVHVEARSFETTELELTVQIGITASGNVRLKGLNPTLTPLANCHDLFTQLAAVASARPSDASAPGPDRPTNRQPARG